MYYDCTNQGVLTKLWETRAILYYRVGQMSRANGQTATLCNRYSLPPLYTFYLHECTYDTYDRPIHQIYGNFYSVNYACDSVRSWLTSKTTYNDSQSLQELQYSYDAVGNIIAIQQNADSVHWLGGQYMQEFQYDAQNRLRRADMISDYWGLYSNYNLTYSPSGMIGIKSCDDMLWNYWHGYCSANDKIINHQVRSIYDMENDATTFYQWDAAGRLQNIYIPCAGDIRHHRWSESGQLAATIDNEHCAFYTYDGNGNRAYKLTGNTMLDQYNAGQQFFHAYLNDAVVYVNPYFTISRKNYTRHIFNGTQRIATEIGTSDLSDCIDTTAAGMERLAYARAYMQSLFAEPIELHSDTGTTFVDIDGEAYDELQWQCFGGDRLWQITIACDSDILLPILRRDSGAADTRVSGKYFYHTDHLGSANWVTKDDEAVQFIHYMPYGEMWYNQRGSAYNERYKYTGKERDEETGNDYFGARYYAPNTPMWLSPDPLMDIYPSYNPYMYCMSNPINITDPNGWGDPLTVMKVRRMRYSNMFGLVRHYNDGSLRAHQGIDYYAPEGTNILAVKDGFIVDCDIEGKSDYGKTITLQFVNDEGNTAWAFYSHLSEINVNKNDKVNEGDIIGKTGVTGNAKNMKGEDQHLHFEYRTGNAKLGKGLNGREDPNLIVDTKFERDPNNMNNVKPINVD